MPKCRKTLLLLITLIHICTAICTAQTYDNGTTVKIGYFRFPGYHMVDSRGMKSGYGFEYMQYIRNYTGWNYEYIGEYEELYWHDMLEMLADGRIDIVTSASKTPEREALFAFSTLPMGAKSTIVTVKAGNTKYHVEDYPNWNGIRVGLREQNYQNEKFAEFAAAHNFTYTPIYFHTESEIAEALSHDKIDAIISSDLRELENEWIIAKFEPQPYYIMVRKNDTQLLAEINRSMKLLYDYDPHLPEELYQKYYSPRNAGEIYFTKKELQYIADFKKNGKILTCALNPDANPYSYFENGVAKGSNVAIASLILGRAGLPFSIVESHSSQEYWDSILNKETDLILAAHQDFNYADKYGYLLCNPYYSMSLSAIHHPSTNAGSATNIALVEDAHFKENAIIPTTIAQECNFSYYPSIQALVEAVKKDKTLVGFLYTNEAQLAAIKIPAKSLIVTKMPLYSTDIVIGVKQELDPILVSIINKATSSLNEEDIRVAVDPYLLYERDSTLQNFIYDKPLLFALIMLSLLVTLVAIYIAYYNNKRTKIERTLNHKLDLAINQTQQANTAKSKFLAQMSHEIRTPMNAIIGLITLANTKLTEPAILSDYLYKIESSSRLLLSIINDILDMSAIESGKMKIAQTDFDFRQEVTAITTIFYQQAKQKSINFSVKLQGVSEEHIIGDALRVKQILMNLLSNALKFTPANGSVQLLIQQTSLTATKVSLRFSVIDSGCGMTPKLQSRVFDAFEQENASTAYNHGGSGLGLAITKNLVGLMGGTIQVNSSLGQGTTFIVDLSFGLSAKVERTVVPSVDTRTLIVDDDTMACQYTGLLLKRLKIRYDATASGAQALEMLKTAATNSDPYKLCLIDWKMQQMDGLELTKKIRATYPKDTIIIIVSAYDLQEISDESRAAGANYLIPKPLFQSTIADVLMTIARPAINSEAITHCAPDYKKLYNFQGKKLLIAEDMSLNMEILLKLLQMVNFQVTCAANGQEAIDAYNRANPGEFAAILLDINMPVVDGYTAAKIIRSSHKSDARTIPIFALTANAFTDDIAKALDAGMNGHIAKPIEVQILYQTLSKAINGEDA